MASTDRSVEVSAGVRLFPPPYTLLPVKSYRPLAGSSVPDSVTGVPLACGSAGGCAAPAGPGTPSASASEAATTPATRRGRRRTR